MRLQVKAHNDRVPDSVRAYTEKRLAKLGRRLYAETHVEVMLSRAHNPSIADDHTVEAVVHAKGARIVASESATTFETAVDRVAEKLERQVERYQKKRRLEPRREAAHKRESGEPEPEPAQEPEHEPVPEQGEAAA